jgi:hypothetical protein
MPTMYLNNETKTLSGDLFFIRGTTISLVVLFHVLGADPTTGVRSFFSPDRDDLRAIAQFIDTFNMDVMFIGSGVAVSLFGRPDRSLWAFLTRKLDKLLIPMLVWAPVFLVVKALSKARPQDWSEWVSLLSRVPTAWSPRFSIFWFVHALIWSTFLFWIFRRATGRRRLGRWEGPVYLALALLFRALAAWWNTRSPGELIGTVEYFLYWNIFFAFGVVIHPYLHPLRTELQSMPRWALTLMPLAFFVAIFVHWQLYPEVHLDRSYLLDGPLAFCMELSLAVLVRDLFRQSGAACDWLQGRIVLVGSISMIVYIFHIYFLSGTRLLLLKLFPGQPLSAHLVFGWLAGIGGPLLLFWTLKNHRLFRWSVGLSRTPVTKAEAIPLHTNIK